MKTRLLLLLTLIFSAVSSLPSLAAGDRYALVIGNAKYPDADAPLKEPLNDARDVADELKRDGFSVDVGENLTGDAMRLRPTPLARMAVISLSALKRPNNNKAEASIAIGSEKLRTYGIRYKTNQPTISKPTWRFTSMSLSCFRVRASSSTKVKTPIVKNRVMAN